MARTFSIPLIGLGISRGYPRLIYVLCQALIFTPYCNTCNCHCCCGNQRTLCVVCGRCFEICYCCCCCCCCLVHNPPREVTCQHPWPKAKEAVRKRGERERGEVSGDQGVTYMMQIGNTTPPTTMTVTRVAVRCENKCLAQGIN